MKKIEFYLRQEDYNWFFKYALEDGQSVNDYILDILKHYKLVSNALALVECLDKE